LKSAALIATAVALLLPCAAHAAACDTLKNATYAGIMRGKFDAYPDAFAGSSLTFDASGVGAGRGVIGYDPASTAAVQSPYAGVTCSSNADGKSGVLNFGPSLGTNSFTVYDAGSRIWVRHEVPGRPVAGWLFRLPAPPRAP
jgi:hypothetical protein